MQTADLLALKVASTVPVQQTHSLPVCAGRSMFVLPAFLAATSSKSTQRWMTEIRPPVQFKQFLKPEPREEAPPCKRPL